MGDGSDHVNVWHYQAIAPVTMTDSAICTTIAAHFDAVYAFFEGWMDPAMTGVDCKVDLVEWLGGKWQITRNLGQVSMPNVNFTPGGAGDVMPHTDAAVVNLRTSLGKQMGRKYIGGLVESAQANGSLVSAAATDLASMFSTWLADVVLQAGEIIRPVIASTVDGVVRDVTEAVISTFLGRQGRRRQDIGT
jgi:hypothetical protein